MSNRYKSFTSIQVHTTKLSTHRGTTEEGDIERPGILKIQSRYQSPPVIRLSLEEDALILLTNQRISQSANL